MKCAKSSQIIFTQIVQILDQIKDDDYSASLPILNESTIGKHFRHILDFYQCILQGAVHGELDYSKRERSQSVETHTIMAKSGFMELQSAIDRLDENKQIRVVTDFFTDDLMERPWVVSSVGRELMYAYDHAVHHLAIIKIGIKATFSYITVDDHIGVAPSTIKFESSQKRDST